ncbi:hypothetical protein [Nocardioides hwasunensis]|uniref:Glycosyltransferase RgtA/B/C/D-like domain-containing protein n=1 Tax=Nocardioides hwasunensis TaxID=397258 RepID=A0ABR8MH12_9ACTN|nr:hypothetical protein [Nocardioides hwasunensis]MBD3913384.1 hypothetical protein [Nocardioides hwasunensis]
MITVFVRRVLPVIGMGAVMMVVATRMIISGTGADTYFHLRFGQEFLDGWSIRSPGHLSAFDSASWTPTQWLAQVGMAGVDDVFGLAGILWLAGTLTMALLVLVYLMARLRAAPLAAALATAVFYVAAAPGLSARPQLLSYVFIAVATHAWLATVKDGRPRYWLVLLAWVWPTVHGMWPFGIMIAVVVLAGMALDRSVAPRALLKLAVIPVASLLLSAATPAGLGAFRSLVDVSSRSDYFAEWGAPDFTSPSSFVLALMLAVVFLVALVRPLPTTWADALMIGMATAWALFTVRTGPAAAIVAAPFLASAIQTFLPSQGPPARREVITVLALAAVSSTVLALSAGSRTSEPVVPAWLDARLDAVPTGTRVLNEWDSGPYFLWRHPQLSLVMHGYGDVFTDDEIQRNADLVQLNRGWDDDVADLEADYALVTADSRLGYALVHQLGWTVLEGDDEFELLSPSEK